MASNRQQKIDRVVEELEQRGAEDPTVRADIPLTKYTTEQDHPGATATVEYLGDSTTVRHACRTLNQVQVLDLTTQPWPGGEQEVKVEITVLDNGSGGATPGGNADSSASSPVPPPDDEDDQNPHAPPGSTFCFRDRSGFTDHHEVAVWPVRWWEPRPDVPACLVLRYIPHSRAEGLEWWSGYCSLGTERPERVLERLREKPIHAAGHTVNVDWHGSSWCGWSEASQMSHVGAVPVFSSEPQDWGELGNQEAGDLTSALAQGVLEARREVLR
jgi:hypothetical protein